MNLLNGCGERMKKVSTVDYISKQVLINRKIQTKDKFISKKGMLGYRNFETDTTVEDQIDIKRLCNAPIYGIQ